VVLKNNNKIWRKTMARSAWHEKINQQGWAFRQALLPASCRSGTAGKYRSTANGTVALLPSAYLARHGGSMKEGGRNQHGAVGAHRQRLA
jgi:hypothetical protein